MNICSLTKIGTSLLAAQFLIVFAMASSAGSETRSTMMAENASMRTNPADLLALLGKYIDERNIDAVMSIHEENAAMVEFGGEIARGPEKIYQLYVDFFKTNPDLKVNARQIVEAGGVAIILGDYTLDYTNALGNVVSVEGKFGDIVRQQENGSWLYVLDNPYAP